MLSRFEGHQAVSYGTAAVPSKTMCRQTLTTHDGTERHRRFYLAVSTSPIARFVGSCLSHQPIAKELHAGPLQGARQTDHVIGEASGQAEFERPHQPACGKVVG